MDIARCSRCMDTRLFRSNEQGIIGFEVTDILTKKYIRCERCKKGFMRRVDTRTTPERIKESIRESKAESKILDRSYSGMKGWQTRVERGNEARSFGARLALGFKWFLGD